MTFSWSGEWGLENGEWVANCPHKLSVDIKVIIDVLVNLVKIRKVF